MTTFDYYRLAMLRGKLRYARDYERRIMDEIRAVEAGKKGVIDTVLTQLIRWCA
ncbi:hypothetical protein AB0118_07525 [Klebsiella quasipneumoniae]|uniref:hypothetical protein n=1 Tax=Klebsiella quasipneumoniae TaxID=1463165 RepID=UPI002406596C|nr:hypothetical protein [Klebsiella quasipneumoniae]MDG0556573.1 hypothetical protein [Klebsiella quasipneumoniae]